MSGEVEVVGNREAPLVVGLGSEVDEERPLAAGGHARLKVASGHEVYHCLLYTSPSPRDRQKSRMPSSA